MITYMEAAYISEVYLLPQISLLYGLNDYSIRQIDSHEGGRNLAYRCTGKDQKIIRISFLPDRRREDYLAEVEYIRYLFDHGASVANVLNSQNGNLLETLEYNGFTFIICLFENAPGKSLAENQYRYREGAPLSEYFYNCGKTLGEMHRLSKSYSPIHQRYDFFEKYYTAYLDDLIPKEHHLLKRKLNDLLNELQKLERDEESYGMVHFDFSDGNYMIDYDTGKITVFDFDNCCRCWYMFDLANLWTHGVGWIQFEPDENKRKDFMNSYFQTILDGYRSEAKLHNTMLEKLPLFVQTVLMENIVDGFEVMRMAGEEPECDEGQRYRIKCMEEDIPFMGFFHEIYDSKAPFEYGGE